MKHKTFNRSNTVSGGNKGILDTPHSPRTDAWNRSMIQDIESLYSNKELHFSTSISSIKKQSNQALPTWFESFVLYYDVSQLEKKDMKFQISLHLTSTTSSKNPPKKIGDTRTFMIEQFADGAIKEVDVFFGEDDIAERESFTDLDQSA